jgi:hypothetical protein
VADSKISDLDEATTLADADEFVLASSGESKRITWASIKAEIAAEVGSGADPDDENQILHMEVFA